VGNFRGHYSGNGKSHKNGFGKGTPLAVPLIDGRLIAKSKNITHDL